MSHSLSDQENVGLGVFAALVEAICLQPTLYWKNARAQGLPFTLNPRMIYRGTTMSMINEMQMMGVQFGTTGFLQRMWLTYVATNSSSNSSISLSMSDELGLSCLGGAISAIPTCPVEVIMINQQKTGHSMINMISNITSNFGYLNDGLMRGLMPCVLRDSIYTCGLLGVTPYTQDYLMKKFDYSQSVAGFYASIVGGCFSAAFSHPLDVIKTCMQGDLQRTKYSTLIGTTKSLYHEGGVKMFFRGLFWRTFNITATVYMANEIRVHGTNYILKNR